MTKDRRAGLFLMCLGAICVVGSIILLQVGSLSEPSGRYPDLTRGAVLYGVLVAGAAVAASGLFFAVRNRK